MSGEENAVENIETNAEDVVNTEVPENSEADASQVTLEDIYNIPDDQLDAAIAGEFTNITNEEESDTEASMSEQESLATEQEAEPPSEEAEEIPENEMDDGVSDSEDGAEIDYQAIYEEIFSPFKANGREIQIDSAEEVKRLMQQGLGYHKKMEEMKPFNKALKLLQQREALDPEKLSFLLDVAEGKPEAISKLLQDQNLDPYDIDMKAEYVSNYEDTEPLDKVYEVIDNLQGEHKLKTLQVLSGDTAWDQESTTRLYKTPEAIVHLNSQVEAGVFDKIMSVVDKERALGNLLGISDLDAYNRIGQELQNQGKLGVPNTPNESTMTSKPVRQTEAQKKKRQKAANAPRKVSSNAVTPETFVPATADPEEIEKFIQDHLRNAAR
jgi:hypothetical protein